MNFKNAINALIRKRKTDPNIYSIEVDSHWTLIFCPYTQHYYAMDMASASCISSTLSCIRPAHRIDPTTGEYDPQLKEKDGSPRKFAIKVFTGDKNINVDMAKNEGAALSENQLVDGTRMNDEQPVLVMAYHPGKMICLIDGTPNYAVLHPLSLKDRLELIFQITNQIHEMHAQKIRKNPRLHIDIKGSNILIDVPEEGPVSARVIDFGSSKVLDASGQTDTGLSGLTPIAIPYEAISREEKAFVTLRDKTGFLNSKSDIYSLGAVYAVMLGASDPYVNRRGETNIDLENYSMRALNHQVTQGFDLTGLLSNSIPELPFRMVSKSEPCAFRNLSQKEAPNDETILADKTLPDLGYVLYKDQLLYVNRKDPNPERHSVSGRDITSKPRTFNPKVAQIRALGDTNELTPANLAQCIDINDAHPLDTRPIDHTLRPLMIEFITQMTELDHATRPSMEEVLQFFTIANKIASMATVKDPTRKKAETELRIQIALLQLNIIIYKGWHITLPLLLPDNTISTEETGSFAQFDFDSLEQNPQLFHQLCDVFCDPGILSGEKPLTANTFNFLHIQSEGKKVFDAILAKLQIPGEGKQEAKQNKLDEKGEPEIKHSELSNLGKKVLKLLATCSEEPHVYAKKGYVKKQDDKEEKELKKFLSFNALPVANKFLSLSKPMMVCLLDEKVPPYFATDFNLMKECVERRALLAADFPSKFEEMKQAFPHPEGFASMATLLEDAPNIALFLSHDLNDASQVANLLKDQYQIEKNTPLTPHSEAKLLALYQEMLRNKEHIAKFMPPETLKKLNDILTQPFLNNLQEYIDKLAILKSKGVTYQKFSLFGAFGYTVTEKHKDATALMTAFKTGDHQEFLTKLQHDKRLNDVVTGKNLGRLSQSLLSCMKINTKPKPTSR